jgi:hypothetical protein
MSASAFSDVGELQRLIDMFTTASNDRAAPGGPAGGLRLAPEAAGAAAAAAAAGGGDGSFALGYMVTPVNVHTGAQLAKPQTLVGTAAMAAHVLLMKIHSKKLVSGQRRSCGGRAQRLPPAGVRRALTARAALACVCSACCGHQGPLGTARPRWQAACCSAGCACVCLCVFVGVCAAHARAPMRGTSATHTRAPALR